MHIYKLTIIPDVLSVIFYLFSLYLNKCKFQHQLSLPYIFPAGRYLGPSWLWTWGRSLFLADFWTIELSVSAAPWWRTWGCRCIQPLECARSRGSWIRGAWGSLVGSKRGGAFPKLERENSRPSCGWKLCWWWRPRPFRFHSSLEPEIGNRCRGLSHQLSNFYDVPKVKK